MKVKIAVFGQEDSISNVNQLANGREDLEIVPFTYEKEDEINDIIEKAFMCDVYLFTDAFSYLLVEQKIKRKRLPTILISHDEHMVLNSLYRLKALDEGIKRLSIDIDHAKSVEHVVHDLKIDKDIFIYDYGLRKEPSIEEVLDHHVQLWEHEKIDHVLTSIQSIKQQLKKKSIPVTYMEPPSINIETSFQRAKSIIKLDLSTGAQVVTGHIRIKDVDAALEKIGHEKMEMASKKLFDILEQFSKKTDIALYSLNPYEIVVFGTKPFITHLKNHYRDFPLLKEIKSKLEIPVSIGYGLGLTAKQSSINSEIALEKANQSSDTTCYIVNERQEKIGPIGVKKEFDTSKLYQALIHKARLNNELSYNFIEFIQSRNNEPFSSNDIANFYNVTKRSAERTVNKLLTGEVIRVSGEERPYQKGRPRKLFTLNQ